MLSGRLKNTMEWSASQKFTGRGAKYDNKTNYKIFGLGNDIR